MKLKRFFIGLVIGVFVVSLAFSGNEKPWEIKTRKINDKVLLLSSWGVNVTAINTQKGIVVIDAHNFPAIAGDIRQEIEKEFGKKNFAYLINTHHHLDNTGGNQIFSDAKILALQCAQDAMQEDNKILKQFISDGKERIKIIESELSKNSISDPAEVDKLKNRKDFLSYMFNDLENNYKLTIPTETIAAPETSIDMGDMTLKLYCFQKCHSQSDLLVVIPEQSLAFTGDLNDRSWLTESYEQNRPAWLTKLNDVIKQNGKIRNVIGSHEPNPSTNIAEYRKVAYFPPNKALNKKSAAFLLNLAYNEKGIDYTIEEYKKMKNDNNSFYFDRNQIVNFIEEIFNQNRDEDAIKMINSVAADNRDELTRDNELESILNINGIKLLREGKNDKAMNCFKTNLKLYPNSWNAFDSYGEGLLAKGDTSQAMQNYVRSLNLNPSSKHAYNVLKRFKPDWVKDNPTEFAKIEDILYKTVYESNVYPNTIISAGNEGMLVVDPGQIAKAAKLCDNVKAINQGDIKYVINTHLHEEHAGGNEVFCKAIPVINGKNIDKNITEGAIFKGALPLIGKEGKTINNYYRMQFNNEEVLIIPEFGLHSETDLIVYFSKSGHVAMGDLLVSESFPVISSNVSKYIAFLETTLDIFPAETKFVSGHGKVYSHSELEKYTKTMSETVKMVMEEIKQGKKIDEILPETILSKSNFENDFISAEKYYWIQKIYFSELR